MWTAAAALLAAPHGTARQVRRPGANDGPPSQVLFLADRTLVQRLSRAQEAIAKGNYVDAVRHLQVVLDSPEDSFFRVKALNEPVNPPANPAGTPAEEGAALRSNRFLGIKAEAERIVGSLPAAGREAYELEYGGTARTLFEEAERSGSLEQLAAASRRYFHTEAGREATRKLAAVQLDRGVPLSAALTLDRLWPLAAADEAAALAVKSACCWMQAGFPDRAADVLVGLGAVHPRPVVALGGQRVPVPVERNAAQSWLQQEFGTLIAKAPPTPAGLKPGAVRDWLLPGGSPERSGVVAAATPFLNGLWNYRLTRLTAAPLDPRQAESEVDLGPELESQVAELREQEQHLVAGLQPLVVQGRVVARGYDHLRALDLATGAELWRSVERDRSLDYLQQANNGIAKSQADAWLRELLLQRGHFDQTYGGLSSDGEYVFCVDDLGIRASNINPSVNHPLSPREYNRLTAYDVRTGKLKWEIGGGPGDFALDLAGTYFLGPPLPMSGELYCLGEASGEVRLYVLDARRGTLLWAQPLAQVETAGTLSRREAGLMPTASGGVLVCPTGAGAVVAVDLARRALLWAFQYESDQQPQLNKRALVVNTLQRNQPTIAQDGWLDSAAVVDGGRVLLTARDAQELFCVSLADGELLWRQPRGSRMYVGGAFDGRVVIVGRRQIELLDLEGGHGIWPSPTPIPAPSGRGLLTPSQYHIPLSTAEVATVDLATGRILTRSRARDGQVPGNLVGVGEMILSQSATDVRCFRPLQSLEAEVALLLAQNPDDPSGLGLRGEIHLNAGRIAEAHADLRRSLVLRDDPRLKEILFESLLEGLRTDFAAQRSALPELEGLAVTPQQRGSLMRVMATGLQSVGDYRGSLSTCLKMIADGIDESPFERLESGVTVRRDRWVLGQLEDLLQSSNDAQKQELAASVDGWLGGALTANEQEPLRRALRYFPRYPGAERVRKRLVELSLPAGYSPEIENWLQALRSDPRPEYGGWALAVMVRQLLNADRPAEAELLLGELVERFGDAACYEDRTGREIAAAHRELPQLHSMRLLSNWPAEAAEPVRVAGQPVLYRFPLRFDGDRGDFFQDVQIHLDQRQQTLVAVDGVGKELWQVRSAPRGVFYNPYAIAGRVHNHILLAVLGDQLVAFDTLGNPDDLTPRTLWQENLFDPLTGGGNFRAGAVFRQMQLPGGGIKMIVTDPQGRTMGTIGAISADSIGLIRNRTLLMLDLQSGRKLWQRSDVPAGSELFGDDDVVVVVPPQGLDAPVYRRADGRSLGTRLLPAPQARLFTLGRSVLTWNREAGRSLLARFDVVEGQPLWQHVFHADAKLSVVDDKDVVVVEPDGRCVIVAGTDGSFVTEARFELPVPLSQVLAIGSSQHIVVCAGAVSLNSMPARQGAPGTVMAFGNFNPVVDGLVAGFERRSGKLLWTTRVDRMGFDVTQPRNLPVIVFGSRVQNRSVAGNRVVVDRSSFELLCIDKRSGKVVLEVDEPGTVTTNLDVTSDPAQNLVSLSLQLQTTGPMQIQLRFVPAK